MIKDQVRDLSTVAQRSISPRTPEIYSTDARVKRQNKSPLVPMLESHNVPLQVLLHVTFCLAKGAGADAEFFRFRPGPGRPALAASFSSRFFCASRMSL
jgi:hypothetical protein